MSSTLTCRGQKFGIVFIYRAPQKTCILGSPVGIKKKYIMRNVYTVWFMIKETEYNAIFADSESCT